MSNPLTFLFTDLENSTTLWENHPDGMQSVMARHDAILKKSIQQCGGVIIKSTGDGFHAYFDSAINGILAAIQGQCALIDEQWNQSDLPIKVRMGLHTGESEQRDGDFYGSTVNRAARMMDIAHGGQVLASEVTVSLSKYNLPADIFLIDKGQHRLKGIAQLEHVYQISSPDLENEFPPLRSLATYKHNLPRQLTSFVGREKELAEIQRLMGHSRLLTLLGPGGTGKTRLMLQSAEEMIQDYPDGVWLVELATLTNPSKIPDRVSAALNLQEQPTRKIIDTLFDYLRQRELLLLIDNVEHLIRECAVFVEELLMQCPKVKVIVTGREALFISGEFTLQIPSLSLPDSVNNLPLEEIRCTESVLLFMERAQSVRPDFDISSTNVYTIADIVKRLDGIPLALELAAARLRMLSVEQIADRLNDRFRLLTGGNRTALPRQQTLQALIDWSWNLLDENEHVLLRRLSVFSGGWTLKAAESITGFDSLDEYMVFDLLEQLINKSVVNVTYPPEGSARYNLLESIRQYAQTKLFEANEGEELRNRHAAYYAEFAEEANRQLRTSQMVQCVKRIEKEFDNIRAVMTWTLDTNPILALQISGSLLYWPAHWIQLSEAKSWLVNSFKNVGKLTEPEKNKLQVEDLIKGHMSLATIYSMYSDHVPAMDNINEALALSEKNDQLRHLAYAHVMKGTILFNGAGQIIPEEWIPIHEKMLGICEQYDYEYELSLHHSILTYLYSFSGKFDLALIHYKNALELSKKINNPFSTAEISRMEAAMAFLQNDYDTAEKALRRAIEYYTTIKSQRFVLVCKSDLAHALRRTGRIEESASAYQETLQLWREQSNLPALAHQFECVAFIAIHRGSFDHAAQLIGKAKEIRASTGAQSTQEVEINEISQAMEQLDSELGETELERLIIIGAEMGIDEAVEFAVAEIRQIAVNPA